MEEAVEEGLAITQQAAPVQPEGQRADAFDHQHTEKRPAHGFDDGSRQLQSHGILQRQPVGQTDLAPQQPLHRDRQHHKSDAAKLNQHQQDNLSKQGKVARRCDHRETGHADG